MEADGATAEDATLNSAHMGARPQSTAVNWTGDVDMKMWRPKSERRQAEAGTQRQAGLTND